VTRRSRPLLRFFAVAVKKRGGPSSLWTRFAAADVLLGDCRCAGNPSPLQAGVATLALEARTPLSLV